MTTKIDQPAAPARTVGGIRRGAGAAYRYLAAFFVLGVLGQVFLAGVGVFGINARTVSAATSLDPHRMWGFVLMLLALALLVLAVIARPARGTVIGTLVLAVLVIVAQMGLAMLGDHSKWFGGLHALDGMVILLLAVWLAVTAWRRGRPARQRHRPQ